MKNAITRSDQSIQQLQTNVNSAKVKYGKGDKVCGGGGGGRRGEIMR